MNIEHWEKICQRDGFQPIGKSDIGKCELFVAERQCPPAMGDENPFKRQTYFEVLWAIYPDQIARRVALPAMWFPVQAQRIKAVCRIAGQWVKDRKQVRASHGLH